MVVRCPVAAFAAIAGAFVLGGVLRYLKWHWLLAWAVSCTIVPAFVVFVEFVLPYEGGGASMWPVALLFGGIYGATAGGFGVLFGWLLRRINLRDT
ncbi:MAG: hypothetical protein HYY46_16245 [Deltaproteobacteria bacterium]|nr:hypothetical protein [Deltaproteobacteria bacterium]